MGKGIYKGLAPKDHPLFSGGVETFSRLAYKESSTSTPSATDGETPPSLNSAPVAFRSQPRFQQRGQSNSQPRDLAKELNLTPEDIEMAEAFGFL